MTVAVSFALIGAVILIGFLAHLLFRVTKIPSVLLLISIGVLLGPTTGWIRSDALISIAPFFGTMALLIILFEGGLELDIVTVLRQAPRASVMAVLAFLFSVGSVAVFAFYGAGYSLLNSVLLASILGATSPAICIPLVSGLSVREEVKTFLKLESALGDVLLLITVVLVLDMHATGNRDAFGMAGSFLVSIAVACGISAFAGVLWSRLIGWMGREPLSYMLTLGFVFLLYFVVEELHGSAAIAVLMFGLMLENMQVIAGNIGEKVRQLFGIDIRAEQFVLDQFMKGITQELSFLIRTFFFVYLGLLLNFRSFDLRIGLLGAGIVVLLLASRWIAVQLLKKRARLSSGEAQAVMAMSSRGLATAVMAFLPGQYGLPGVELFPIYAFVVIVLTNMFMTAGILFSERRLAAESGATRRAEIAPAGAGADADAPSSAVQSASAAPGNIEQLLPTKDGARGRSGPASFADWMAGIFGIRLQERETRYIEAIRASSMADAPFWVEVILATIVTALGLVLNQSAIIIGAALIVPFVWPMLASGLALAAGDVYLLLKLLVKFALVVILVTALSALFTYLLPFNTVTTEMAARTRPTILDFLVAFFAGIAGAGLFSAKKRILHYLPGALVAITLLPPLVVMGLSLDKGLSAEIFRGSALLFVANFFAVILGASLVFAAVGMGGIGDMEFIRAWKGIEFNRPIVNFMLNKLGLIHFIGRAGTLRARLTVTLVFLLALVIPLQMAFNQLSNEFRTRQAVAEIEKMFAQPDRSAIINSRTNLFGDRIEVRIQLATNKFYTSADIRNFEQRIADRAGRPTRLDLVQSLGDLGEGKTISAMFTPPQPEPAAKVEGLNGLIAELQTAFENKLRAVVLPSSIVLLSASTELVRDSRAAAFQIDYLAETTMASDAAALLAGWLEREMSLPPGNIRLNHVRSKYEFQIMSRTVFSDSDIMQLRELSSLMMRYPHLHMRICMPGQVPERTAALLRNSLESVLLSPEISARAGYETAEEADRLTINLGKDSSRHP